MSLFEKVKTLTTKTIRTIGEVFYGMTVYDWVHELETTRNEHNRLFTMIVFGDLIGVPILPPY